MRPFLVSALVLLAACGASDADDAPAAHGAPSATASMGPDPVVLRVPRTGGVARAYVYPALDSLVWRSPAALPAVARMLAFDPEGGQLAYVDDKGRPIRLDLRLGGVTIASKAGLTGLASADGSAIYGVEKGKVARLTPTGGRWAFETPPGLRDVVPLADGGVVLVAARGDSTLAWRVRPPDTRLLDTAALPRTSRAFGTPLGDRVYLVGAGTLHALRGRDLEAVPPLAIEGDIVEVAITPSGDRLYVALRADPQLRLVDRYRGVVTGVVALPAPPAALRMDPLGRYLLARGAGDQVHVLATGTGRVLGTLRGAWRDDLPLVTPDGLVALARGADVVMADAETLADRRVVAGGAADSWHVVLWNGFRPRARGLDVPVVFAPPPATSTESIADAFATEVPRPSPPDSQATPVAPVPAPAPVPDARPAAPAPWTLQFAALRDEATARALAARVVIDGERARVVTGAVAGTPIHRVVMGPFRSKADADRRGRAAGRDYVVYAGSP